MDTEKDTIELPGDVVETPTEEKCGEALEDFLVKESSVPTHHSEHHHTKKMIVMRRSKMREEKAKAEQSLASIFCAWIVEYQLGMSKAPTQLSGKSETDIESQDSRSTSLHC